MLRGEFKAGDTVIVDRGADGLTFDTSSAASPGSENAAAEKEDMVGEKSKRRTGE